MREKIILQGRKVVGGKAQGEAIVSREAIAFYGGVDTLTGIVVERGHQLEGRNVSNKILVYPNGKGSTGNTYFLYDMATRGTAPKALIQVEAEPIQTLGAIMGNIPLVEIKDNPLEIISDGDYLEVDGDNGVVIVTKKESHCS